MGYWYRVSWFDQAGNGRFADTEADSDNHAVWKMAMYAGQTDQFVRVRLLADAEVSRFHRPPDTD